MPEKIIYYVQRYRPKFEAISKEVSLLANHFKKIYSLRIHDLHLGSLTNFSFNKKISYHFAFYPFFLPVIKLLSFGKLNYIYTSLADLPYLTILSPKNTLLTAAASCSYRQVHLRLKKLKKLRKIIVETEKHRDQAVEAKCDSENRIAPHQHRTGIARSGRRYPAGQRRRHR